VVHGDVGGNAIGYPGLCALGWAVHENRTLCEIQLWGNTHLQPAADHNGDVAEVLETIGECLAENAQRLATSSHRGAAPTARRHDDSAGPAGRVHTDGTGTILLDRSTGQRAAAAAVALPALSEIALADPAAEMLLGDRGSGSSPVAEHSNQ
jgi:hypothetical protein